MASQPDGQDLGGRIRQWRANLAHRVGLLTSRHARYQRLFADDKGALSSDGREFFAEVAALGRIGAPIFHADPHEMARRAGAHDMAVKLFSGLELDGAKLAALTRQLRETGNE